MQCKKDLKHLKINIKCQDITKYGRKTLLNLLNAKAKNAAQTYLQKKMGKKGRSVDFYPLEMSDYLKPNDSKLSIKDQKELFSIRNRMILVKENFSNMNIPEN